MGVRATMLELAILGELERPTHGYELRQQLSTALGPVRRLSFGSLYPALHRLSDAGLIEAKEPAQQNSLSERAPRRQVIYTITEAGRLHLQEHLREASVDDDSLGLTMRLMSKATPATRLELLKQRRAQVVDRQDANRQARLSDDSWISARAELDVEQDNNELNWIDRLIASTTDDSSTERRSKRRPGRQQS